MSNVMLRVLSDIATVLEFLISAWAFFVLIVKGGAKVESFLKAIKTLTEKLDNLSIKLVDLSDRVEMIEQRIDQMASNISTVTLPSNSSMTISTQEKRHEETATD